MKVSLKLLAKRTIPFLAYLTLSVVCGATLHCLLWGPLTPFTPAQYLLLCPRKTLRPRFVAAVLQEYLNCCLFCIFSMWAYLTAELDFDSSNTCKVLRLLTFTFMINQSQSAYRMNCSQNRPASPFNVYNSHKRTLDIKWRELLFWPGFTRCLHFEKRGHADLLVNIFWTLLII